MSRTVLSSELQIAPVMGEHDGKIVRISIKPFGGKRVLVEVPIGEFARAVMSGRLVRADWIEDGK